MTRVDVLKGDSTNVFRTYTSPDVFKESEQDDSHIRFWTWDTSSHHSPRETSNIDVSRETFVRFWWIQHYIVVRLCDKISGSTGSRMKIWRLTDSFDTKYGNVSCVLLTRSSRLIFSWRLIENDKILTNERYVSSWEVMEWKRIMIFIIIIVDKERVRGNINRGVVVVRD